MESDNEPRDLQEDAVVSLRNTPNFLIPHSTFKVSEFLLVLHRQLGKQQQWFAEGVECEVLTPGAGWQKGRVRICLEFCPEEPILDEPLAHDLDTENEHSQDTGSPLDEIRLKMQENA